MCIIYVLCLYLYNMEIRMKPKKNNWSNLFQEAERPDNVTGLDNQKFYFWNVKHFCKLNFSS